MTTREYHEKLIRMNPELTETLERLAAEDRRSVTQEINILLAEAIKARGEPLPKTAQESKPLYKADKP